jgi:hypothetical protein
MKEMHINICSQIPLERDLCRPLSACRIISPSASVLLIKGREKARRNSGDKRTWKARRKTIAEGHDKGKGKDAHERNTLL